MSTNPLLDALANQVADVGRTQTNAEFEQFLDTVDAKITEQVKAGVFPLRLANEDWASGETVWLLDVIARDRKAATAVLANFKQLSGEREVKIHPLVARLIDQDVLEKIKMRAAGPETGQGVAKAGMKGSA